jgi:hypothetical protein
MDNCSIKHNKLNTSTDITELLALAGRTHKSIIGMDKLHKTFPSVCHA